jgi:hypothetical protein
MGALKNKYDQPPHMLSMVASYCYMIYFFPLSSNIFGFLFLDGLLSGHRTMGVLASYKQVFGLRQAFFFLASYLWRLHVQPTLY